MEKRRMEAHPRYDRSEKSLLGCTSTLLLYNISKIRQDCGTKYCIFIFYLLLKYFLTISLHFHSGYSRVFSSHPQTLQRYLLHLYPPFCLESMHLSGAPHFGHIIVLCSQIRFLRAPYRLNDRQHTAAGT